MTDDKPVVGHYDYHEIIADATAHLTADVRKLTDAQYMAWIRERVRCASCKWWKVCHDDEGTEEWGDCTEPTVSMEYADGGFHTSRYFGCIEWEPKP